MKRYYSLLLFALIIFLDACSEGQLGSLEQLAKGAALYDTHCENCHQKDGSGLAGLMPPLADADYLKANASLLPCIIQNGLKGEIKVNGKSYQLTMPSNKKLTNTDIANLTAFVHKKYLKEDLFLSDSVIKKNLQKCVPPDSLQVR